MQIGILNKRNRKMLSATLATFLLINLLSGWAATPSIQAAEGVNDLVHYRYDDGAKSVGENLSVTSGVNFSDGYMRFELEGGSHGNETLTLNPSPITTDLGIITFDETNKDILLGGEKIGTFNIPADDVVEIDFSVPILNGEFEGTAVGAISTSTITGWTINSTNSNPSGGTSNQVWLPEALISKTNGDAYLGKSLNADGTYTVTGATYEGGPTYAFISDWVDGVGNAITLEKEGLQMALSGGSKVKTIEQSAANGKFLTIGFSNGTIGSTKSAPAQYGSAFGPEAVSEPFIAKQGDRIIFDWQSRGEDDNYEVYGFLYNTETAVYTELMYGRGQNQPWVTAGNVIPADGTYQFRFVAGSYDATGGTKLGATLNIDNVRIRSGYVDRNVVDAIVSRITYENIDVAGTIEAIAPSDTLLDRVIKAVTEDPATRQISELGQVTVRLGDQLELLRATMEESALDVIELEFNLPVRADLDAEDFTGMTLTAGGEEVKIAEVLSVDGAVVKVRLEAPIEPPTASFTISYNDDAPSLVDYVEDSSNKLEDFGPINGEFILTPLELVKVSTDVDDPRKVKLTFNKPVAAATEDIDLTGLTIGGQSVTLVEVSGNAIIVLMPEERPYQDEDLISYDETLGKIADANYPNDNVLGNIDLANQPGDVVDGRLPDLAFMDNGTPIDWSPVFDPNANHDYAGVVPNSTDEVSISPYPLGDSDNTHTVITLDNSVMDNEIISEGQLPNVPLAEGRNEIEMTIYDKETNEAVNRYTFVVWRTSNKLADAEPASSQSNTLNLNFDPLAEEQTMNVPNQVRELQFTLTPVDPQATIEMSLNGESNSPVAVVNGISVISDIPLQVGRNTIVFTVTDQKGESRTYTLIVNRANSSPSGGVYIPPTEVIEVDVAIGGENAANVTKVPIKRTTGADGSIMDQVTFTEDKALETVNKAKESGESIARVIIPDKEDKVSEVNVDIPVRTTALLQENGIDLEIYTENAIILLPNPSLDGIAEDFYFRLVPVKDPDERREIEERARIEAVVRQVAGDNDIEVVARPMTIETNLSSRPVTLTLPLRDVRLPAGESERTAFLAGLGIFIEHSDGEKEVAPGKLVTYSNGLLGLQFSINKFSTFTIINFNDQEFGEHTAYLLGFPDGEFKPDQMVTRAQMALMIARNLGFESSEPASSAPFHDVPLNHYAAHAISFVSGLGIMNGYPDGSFQADNAITRAEMSTLVANYLKLAIENNGKQSFNDTHQHWAQSVIEANAAVGIMKGYPDGSFGPDQNLTRAEAVVVVNQLFDRGPLYGITDSRFPDVADSHWAYEDIQEAAIDHHYIRDAEQKEQYMEQ